MNLSDPNNQDGSRELPYADITGPPRNTLADVESYSVVIHTGHIAKKVEDIFGSALNLAGVIIVDRDGDHLSGMISRKRFMELYSQPFRKELHNKKPLKLLLKYGFDAPLCLDEGEDIDRAVSLSLARIGNQIYEPIVVRKADGGLKLIDVQPLFLKLAEVCKQQSQELRETLSRVKQLEGIISICMDCKKIRNDSDSWDQLEVYISSHSEALFSHGVCPECYKKRIDEINTKR